MLRNMRLSHHRQKITPKFAFVTAQGGMDSKETIVVELEHDSITGFGEVAPSRLYGQSLEKSEAALDAIREVLAEFPTPFEINTILDKLIERFDDQRAAIAAVDSAIYDWVAKKLGVPVWKLLGLPRPNQLTTYTIGLATLEETRVKIEEAIQGGFTAWKVKVGGAHDVATLNLIRERFPGPLFLDANEAWTHENASKKIRELARFKPVMIEQPLPGNQWPHLKVLRELGVAPIFADESCERPSDVVKLHGYVDGVNIKFTKCGGIREALKMIHLARGLNMKIMFGCFVSSSLAIAPALAISSLVDYADLDGHLLLKNDPFTGIGFDSARLTLGNSPGIGVRPS